MPIVPQHASATADASGDATFTFPDVPQGEIWCGTTQIPGAPATAVGMVTASGELIGQTTGSGSFGPWTCGSSRHLVISITGLTPHQQYQAIWHADSSGASFSTYPAAITPTTVAGGGSVDVANFPAVQTVDGTVDVGNFPGPPLAPSVASGQVTMTGAAVPLPSHVPVVGVVLSAPASNVQPVSIGNPGVTAGTGLILSPGQAPTPVLPVANSDVLSVIGTSSDVVSFLVI